MKPSSSSLSSSSSSSATTTTTTITTSIYSSICTVWRTQPFSPIWSCGALTIYLPLGHREPIYKVTFVRMPLIYQCVASSFLVFLFQRKHEISQSSLAKETLCLSLHRILWYMRNGNIFLPSFYINILFIEWTSDCTGKINCQICNVCFSSNLWRWILYHPQSISQVFSCFPGNTNFMPYI